MPPLVRIQINHRGVEELLKSPAMARLLQEMGRSIASSAGSGHEVEVDPGPNRVRVEVRTETFEAMRSEAHHRTLTSAVDAGRR